MRRTTFELKANLKVVAENYLECYHCKVAHPATRSPSTSARPDGSALPPRSLGAHVDVPLGAGLAAWTSRGLGQGETGRRTARRGP
ncbi:MAG: hypothetical protein M3500_17610 [Actinomycetota bacterium]|nr:hypothetical protein [Actinomycetota bacterium]